MLARKLRSQALRGNRDQWHLQASRSCGSQLLLLICSTLGEPVKIIFKQTLRLGHVAGLSLSKLICLNDFCV